MAEMLPPSPGGASPHRTSRHCGAFPASTSAVRAAMHAIDLEAPSSLPNITAAGVAAASATEPSEVFLRLSGLLGPSGPVLPNPALPMSSSEAAARALLKAPGLPARPGAVPGASGLPPGTVRFGTPFVRLGMAPDPRLRPACYR